MQEKRHDTPPQGESFQRLSLRLHSGRLLLETIVGLGFMALCLSAIFFKQMDKQRAIDEAATADIMKTLAISAQNYLNANQSLYNQVEDNGKSWQIPMIEPELVKYFPAHFAADGKALSGLKIAVRSDPSAEPPKVSALIVSAADYSLTGGALSSDSAGRIASLIGRQGGYSSDLAPEIIEGTLGLWSADLADYFPDEELSGARVALRVEANIPQAFAIASFRDNVSGFPDGTSIATDLDMGSNSVVNLALLGYRDENGKARTGFTLDPATGRIAMEKTTEELRVADGAASEDGALIVGGELPAAPYSLDPAGISALKDVKLESLGGAALSEVLPKLSLHAVYSGQSDGSLIPAPGFKAEGGVLVRDAAQDTCPLGYSPSVRIVGRQFASGTNQTATADFPSVVCDYRETTSTCQITTTTKTLYSCPSGWFCSSNCSSSSGRCYKDSSTSTPATKTCPSGYTMSGSNCVKTTTQTCTCPSAYVRSGSICSKPTTTAATCTCPAGYSLKDGSGPSFSYDVICSKTNSTAASCSRTGSFFGSNYQEKSSCINGSYKVCGSTTDQTGGFNCSGGSYVSGCSAKSGTGCNDSNFPYPLLCTNRCSLTCYDCTCPSGYLLRERTCSITSSAPATCTCPSGYGKTGSSCVKMISSICTCPSGYSLSGSTCSLSSSTSFSYTCPSGYTLSGTTCSKTTRSSTDTVSSTGTVISSNSCPFTSYSSPPSPWSRISLSGSTYTFQKTDKSAVCPTRPLSGSAPADFTGRQASTEAQTLFVGGRNYTSGWKLLLGGKAVSANVHVYCRRAEN